MAKGKGTAVEAKAEKLKTETDGHVHAAVLKLATAEGPLKLQPKRGETDGLFPEGKTQPIKDAIAVATTGESPLFRSVGLVNKVERYELAPAGVRAVGAAVEHSATGMTAADAIRLAERVMQKHLDTVAELGPLVERLEARRTQESAAEEKQRKEDAERQQAIREAFRRWEAGVERRKLSRIEELLRELAELGGVPEPTAPKGHHNPVPAPKDAKEFVRQEARRLVSAWADAVRLGKKEAERALEVVLGNLSAIRQVGEAGESTTFDPVHHECETAISTDSAAEVVRPGWVLVEENQTEYVVAKARVQPRAQ